MSKNSKARPHPGIQTGSIEFSLTMPLVLLAAAAADANSAHDLAVRLDGNATRENHHPGMVRYVDAEELVSRRAVAAKLQRRDIEGLRSEGLVDGDVDAAKPRPIHAHESRQVGACIDDGNIHRLADFLRLHDPSANDSLRLFHCHHDSRTPHRGQSGCLRQQGALVEQNLAVDVAN
jgi:hypothetical protein